MGRNLYMEVEAMAEVGPLHRSGVGESEGERRSRRDSRRISRRSRDSKKRSSRRRSKRRRCMRRKGGKPVEEGAVGEGAEEQVEK